MGLTQINAIYDAIDILKTSRTLNKPSFINPTPEYVALYHKVAHNVVNRTEINLRRLLGVNFALFFELPSTRNDEYKEIILEFLKREVDGVLNNLSKSQSIKHAFYIIEIQIKIRHRLTLEFIRGIKLNGTKTRPSGLVFKSISLKSSINKKVLNMIQNDHVMDWVLTSTIVFHNIDSIKKSIKFCGGIRNRTCQAKGALINSLYNGRKKDPNITRVYILSIMNTIKSRIEEECVLSYIKDKSGFLKYYVQIGFDYKILPRDLVKLEIFKIEDYPLKIEQVQP